MLASTIISPIRAWAARRGRSLARQGLADEPRSLAVQDELDPLTLLWKTPGELERLVARLSRDDLAGRFGSDPWLHNYLLGLWETARGEIRATAYPSSLTLAITSTCNAQCTFCSVPMRRTRNPALGADLASVPHLELILRHVRILILTGGEPTIHPRFAQMLRRLSELLDPRAYAMMITHGGRLHRFKAELSEININFTVSLNAATPATHHRLMKLGPEAFSTIVDSVRWARSIGRNVDLSFVVVRENLSEVPDFLRLAKKLDVHAVYLRTLIPGDYYAAMFPDLQEFQRLPAWNHPDIAFWQERARETIAELGIRVFGDIDQWSVPLQTADLPPNTDLDALIASLRDEPALVRTKGDPLPPGSTRDDWRHEVPNPYGRKAPFACGYPWQAIKILDASRRVFPCGFIHQIMGHEDIGLEGSDDFFDLWNSAAMMHLRRTLREGPLLPECVTCPYQMGGEGQCQSKSTTAG